MRALGSSSDYPKQAGDVILHTARFDAFIRPLTALAVVCLLLGTGAAAARANMAERRPGSRPGDAPREPSGGLKSVRVERETLVIDLRPLEDGRPAVVEASYAVRNEGEARELDLVFVAAAMRPGASSIWNGRGWAPDPKRGHAEGGVWLDGRPVEARADADAQGLPASWAAPAQTPGLDPQQGSLPYEPKEEGTLSFRVTLAPGAHELRVRYEARPGAYCDAKSHAIFWQLGYVLAPAREWAGFGGLDAKVLLPAGWRARAEPEMRRDGSALVGSWDTLPADALALTAQTDERVIEDSDTYWLSLIILGALCTAASVFAGWKLGRRLGARRRTSAWGLLVSPPVAVALVAVSAAASALVARPRAPRQACFNEVGNYDFIITFFLVVILFTWHFLVTQAATFIARRRTNLK